VLAEPAADVEDDQDGRSPWCQWAGRGLRWKPGGPLARMRTGSATAVWARDGRDRPRWPV